MFTNCQGYTTYVKNWFNCTKYSSFYEMCFLLALSFFISVMHLSSYVILVGFFGVGGILLAIKARCSVNYSCINDLCRFIMHTQSLLSLVLLSINQMRCFMTRCKKRNRKDRMLEGPTGPFLNPLKIQSSHHFLSGDGRACWPGSERCAFWKDHQNLWPQFLSPSAQVSGQDNGWKHKIIWT